MNKLTKWLISPFLKEEFGAPAGTLPSPSQKKIKKAKKKLDKYGQRSVYSEDVTEQKEIKKTIAIYPGRFQPFGPHHKAVFDRLKRQFDDVYIVTSDIKKPPRHPLNFREKKAHMVKMGVPAKNIFKSKQPYKPVEVFKYFDENETAAVFALGKKDASRLSGGKYFQPYKKGGDMNGFLENGYVMIAPHVSVKLAGEDVSGTVMRKVLGSNKISEPNRKKLFKKLFGYSDNTMYKLLTTRFKSMNEIIEKFLSESNVSTIAHVDDGPVSFYANFADYMDVSKDWLGDLGAEVIDYIVSNKAQDPAYDPLLKTRIVSAVAHGTTLSPRKSIARYKNHINNRVLQNIGFEVVKWMGLKSDTEVTGVSVLAPVAAGADGSQQNTDRKKLSESILFETMTIEEGIRFDNFLKDFSKKAKQPFSKIKQTMNNKNTFVVAKLNDFSVDKVLDSAKKGFQAYQKILNVVPNKIAKKLAGTKFGQKKEKALKKLDNFLQKNPKLKKVMGLGAASAVTYAWTKMTFIGDPEYDLDLSAVASAASGGDYSLADMFGGEMGTKFLVLTAVGATTGLTAPYTKILGNVGTMAAGLGFGAIRAYKKKKGADKKKEPQKNKMPDTVKNPNPRGRKKMVSKQSAVRWVAKNKGNKAAQKYQKSLSEELDFDSYVNLLIKLENVIVKNKQSGNRYIAVKHNPNTQDLVKKTDSVSSKKRMDTIKSFGKDPHGNLYLGDDEVGYSSKVHKAQYVTETDDSMVIGTPHMSNDDPKAGEFVKKQVVPMVQDFIKKHGAENVVFLAEGGQGDGHNYHEDTEQELVGKMVEKAGGSVDTWDGKYNEHTNQDAPIYKDLAKKMNATPSQMTGAMYAFLVGQGDDGEEAMDYLTDDGKQWLSKNGYKGDFPPSDEDVEQLFNQSFPEDTGKAGSTTLGKAQLAWNQLRRDNMARKMEELKKQGKKVLVVPGATHGSAINAQSKSKKEIKETKLFSPNWWTQELQEKELLLMGGAAGHMSHPFDNHHLTFGDFKNIIDMSLQGKLNREDKVTEKLDGQNLMISWKNNKLVAARNKGNLKNFGESSLDVKGMKSKFAGRGDVEKAFVGAMKDLESAVNKLSEKQKEKVFGEGKRWMNLEIVYPKTANVIDYDVSELFFHGSVEVDESGQTKKQVKDSARMLEGMIRQINQNIQKRFKISKPVILNLPKVQDYTKKKKYFLGKLRKLQTIYKLKDNDTLGMYHEMYWREYIFNASKQMKYKIPKNVLDSLTRRWAFLDKSFRLDKKNIKHDKFLEWSKATDKFDLKKLQQEHIKPFELLFLELGAEILKNLDGYLAVNPQKAVKNIKKDLKSAISTLKSSKDIKTLNLLKKNLEKIQNIGGSDSIVPSEGLVFKYNGDMYKFTGAFAPVNQILGALKFVR